jgi:hypothetical protein
VPGVRAITPLHAAVHQEPMICHGPCTDALDALMVTCSQLSRSPTLGHCPADAATARLIPAFLHNRTLSRNDAKTIWPSSPLTAAAVDRLPVHHLVLDTDGSTSAIETTRTMLEQAFPNVGLPVTIAESNAQTDNVRLKTAYQQLVTVVILASLVVAGCSLAVSVVTGLTDRKRPFSLLRLAGAPLALLRRVVIMETAVPLLILAVVSIGTGLLAAGLFLVAQLDESLQAPDGAFWITVVAGILAALGVTATTLPILERITGVENARND